MSDRLPQHLVDKILIRLPVKTLLRFRSVSKTWLSLIDGPDFIKMHLNQSLSLHSDSTTFKSNHSLILKNNEPKVSLTHKGMKMRLYSVNLDKLKRAVVLEYPFECSSDIPPDVLCYCNGLFLLSDIDILVIWNPSTKKYNKIQPPPVLHPNSSFTSVYETCGFGYDTVNDDYKVVRMVEFCGKFRECIMSEVKFYSLKSNSWKRIQDFPFSLPFSRIGSLYFQGALHSLVMKHPGPDYNVESFHPLYSDDSPKLILAIDIGLEEYRLVPGPPCASDVLFDMNVAVFGGCLCITSSYQDKFDIWVMKDYGVKESWTKLLTLVPPVVGAFDRLTPLAYSKSGDEILLNYEDKELLWYDQRTKVVTRTQVRGMPPTFHAEVCVESLLPVNGYGGRYGVKKQQGQEKRKENTGGKKRDCFLSEGFKLVL